MAVTPEEERWIAIVLAEGRKQRKPAAARRAGLRTTTGPSRLFLSRPRDRKRATSPYTGLNGRPA